MGLDRPLKTVQVTSPTASEGKTTTVANLAVALASIGKRVVVVAVTSAVPASRAVRSQERCRVHDGVARRDRALAALQPVKGVNGLLVLASGKPPPNPAELLAGARAAELFKALADNADIVLVDSPPVLPVTDAAVIANRVDGTILVASATTSQRKRFKHAIAALEQVESHVVGAVLNDAPLVQSGYGYGYGYVRRRRTPGDGPRNGAPAVTRRRASRQPTSSARSPRSGRRRN